MPLGHHFLLLQATPTRHLIKALQVFLAINLNNTAIINHPINLVMIKDFHINKNLVDHLKATIHKGIIMIPGVTMVIYLMIDMARQESQGMDDLVVLSIMNKDNKLMTQT